MYHYDWSKIETDTLMEHDAGALVGEYIPRHENLGRIPAIHA